MIACTIRDPSNYSVQEIRAATAHIREYLHQYGIDFEGKALPVSLLPTVVTERSLLEVTGHLKIIRQLLIQVIDNFLSEYKQGNFDSPLLEFFRPYEKWWDLIAGEQRSLPQINLMRYDAILDPRHRWSLLETNSACPGGTIHCARIRRAWLDTALGRDFIRDLDIIEQPIDSPESLIRHMIKLAESTVSGSSVNLAFCTFKGFYTNELDSLQKEHARLKDLRAIPDGQCFICDIRELSFENNALCFEGTPLHIIHNKFDPLMIDPFDPEIEAWLKGARSDKTHFLNGLGATYLTEAKRAFALLSDPLWRTHLSLSFSSEDSVLAVPFTRLLDHFRLPLVQGPNLRQLLVINKDHFVLKADALTRGAGVVIGCNTTSELWERAIAETLAHNGVVQRRADIPKRLAPYLDDQDQIGFASEFYGIDLFLFGNAFAGPVSRCHSNMIFNVGSGGKEAPTLVIREGPV